MKYFNYDNIELLDNYKNVIDVPIEVLKSLNVFSENIEINQNNMEWFKDNFNAIKAGYKTKKEWEEDMMDLMYPEGYNPDSDGDIFDDE